MSLKIRLSFQEGSSSNFWKVEQDADFDRASGLLDARFEAQYLRRPFGAP